MRQPELDVVTFGNDLRRSLGDYLLSTNPIADSEPELRDRLQALVPQGDFCKPPFVHALPVYRPAESVKALATEGDPPLLHTRRDDGKGRGVGAEGAGVRGPGRRHSTRSGM